ITVEGVVGVNRGYEHARQRDLGKVWQLELTGTRPQPCACTVVCTEDAGDVPLGATIRITGYFVMIRNYLGPSQRTQSAALLVAAGPTQIAGATRPAAAPGAVGWYWFVGPATVGLLIAWILIRRASAGRAKHDIRSLAARNAAPQDLSGDLADWAGRDDAE